MSDSPQTPAPAPSPTTIPVICDQCRATGMAGDHAFAAIPDILAFDPVPRRAHANGWTPEHQRAFIAALAITGSPRAAARHVGRAQFGADQLRKAPGGRSFSAAWDAALDLARDRELARLHGNLGTLVQASQDRDSTALADGRNLTRHLTGDPEDPDTAADGESEERKLEMLDRLAAKFLRKVIIERQARLGGEIAAADFYLRQITHLEVMFDLMASDAGLGAWAALKSVQRGGHGLQDIAETPFTRHLDNTRRTFWIKAGELSRPPTVPAAYLEDHGDHSIEPSHAALGQCSQAPPGVDGEAWAKMDVDEQERARAGVFSQAAEDQLRWEEAARREYEERLESDASS